MNPDTWARHRLANRLQSALLLGAMGGFLGLLGWLLWGPDGVTTLVVCGALLVVFQPAVGGRLVMRLYGATPLHPSRAPGLHRVLVELARRAGLEAAPALYYLPSRVVNAFSAGAGRGAAVAVTDGLLRTLEDREVVGVLAHEVSHIRANDLWVLGLADLFSRLTGALSLVGQLLLVLNLPLILWTDVHVDWLAVLALLLGPQVSTLAQLGLSRTREYDADLGAARLTGDPEGLARALMKLESAHGSWWERLLVPGRRVPEPSLLRTHPPTRERVARLRERTLPAAEPPWLHPGAAPAPLFEALATTLPRRPRWHVGGLWH